MTTPTSCKKRGCGNTENHPPEKRTFFNSLFPARMATPKYGAAAQPNTAFMRQLAEYGGILNPR